MPRTHSSKTIGPGPQGGRKEPIRLHPDNPHYLLFRGKPTVLITSGEHYGAVLNLDFDYIPYLDELQARGFNLTRAFSGVYCEGPGSFNIKNNTLAPLPNRFICPWARSATPGYANGGNKFDLNAWDPAYFNRLKDFLREAGRRGIVVELSLFCPFYEDAVWNLSPMNAANNINGIGTMPRTEAYTLKHPFLLAVQDAVTRKIVSELKDFDNLYYEVCNEPYFGGVTADWQDHIIATLVEAEASLPARHLIAQNIANGSAEVRSPNKAVSIFNFHYATPPDAVSLNYGLNKVIADDETGFKGSDNLPYRAEGWDFILAGGAVYDNLDYSFTPDHEDGTAQPDAPGGGGPTLRSQLKILKDFITRFDFIHMAPDNTVFKGGIPEDATARALVEPENAWAIYIKGGTQANLILDLPAGAYRAEWLNTRTGASDKTGDFRHDGGERTLASPKYTEDIALALRGLRE
jgi:hypothetical protein